MSTCDDLQRAAAQLPGVWLDATITVSRAREIALGFSAWYLGHGCNKTAFDDVDWRAEAAVALAAFLETQVDPQPMASYLLGSDRAILRLALASERDSATLLAWLRTTLIVGLGGVQSQVLHLAEESDLPIAAGADLVLAHWLTDDVSDAVIERARTAASHLIEAGSYDATFRRAGETLLTRLAMLRGSPAHPIATTEPASLPMPPAPVAMARFSLVPILFGGAGGILILLAAWLRRRRGVA